MEDRPRPPARFPWGFAVVALLPLVLAAVMFGAPVALGPQDGMGPAMLCGILYMPVYGGATALGLIRLRRGDQRRFPALPWLVAIPSLVTIVAFIFG